ncbi:lysine--tRNA ligase [Candidatus Parcubacteria bacterium]|nr:lysine--tRNA ligase [Candidatus Parcubacteria bacterium]
MFWADRIAESIEKDRAKDIAAGPLVIRDEKTASGRVHVGSMRGAAIHGLVSQVLADKGVANTFYWEINDFDPMDGMPVYLDEAVYRQYMGKPLYTIPSPDGKAKNFAEYYGEEFAGVLKDSGFYPTYYRASELYLSGRMNEAIRIALEKAEDIRRIYKEVSGSERADTWLPLSVVCEKCGKIGTTTAVSFDGEKVTYRCEAKKVEWAEGCSHEGSVSPFDGRAKLPWKVEWAAKFKVMNVMVEGGGKDHSTKGGARDVANRISREVFGYEPPFDIPYEFFLIGGKKMSSSKGRGSSAREVADLLPPHIFRLGLLSKDINQAINFDPEGDTIPVLFDLYDRLAEKYFVGETDDHVRMLVLSHKPEDQKSIPRRFLPRFSLIAFLVQMPHLDLFVEVEKMKGSPLTQEDKEETELRALYAKKWLEECAPEDFKYELAKELPEAAKSLSPEQKKAVKAILEYVEANPILDGQLLHTALHEMRKALGIEAADFFSAVYLSFLGKPSGPKAGWFLSVLERELLLSRLREASS